MERYIYNINKKDISIDRAELAQRLNIPRDYTSDVIEKSIRQVMASCNPKCCYAKVSVCLKDDKSVCFDFASFLSKDLHKNLQGCKEAFVMGITLGLETDRLITTLLATSKAEGFVADAVASAMAEAVMDNMNDYLNGMKKLRPRFSPGYGDMDISYQKDVLEALSADKLLGIKLGENLIMTPRKSITAISGIINE